MSLIKPSASILRSPTAAWRAFAAIRKSLTLRSPMLAASAMAISMSGTAYAAEPSAVDYFVAKVMVAPTASDSSSGRANSTGATMPYASAQDQFVDKVLKGRFPEGIPASQLMNTHTNSSAAWPDVGFLRSVSAR